MLTLDQQNALRELYRLQQPGWEPATERYAALCRSHIRPESRVLDLGCGRGGLVEQLKHPPARMVGIDADLRSLVEHRLPAMPRVRAESRLLPLSTNSLDVVLSSWLLEHLEQPLSVLQQVARVLKPVGSFLFITPNGRHPLSVLNRSFGRLARLQGVVVKTLYGRAEGDTFPTRYRANTPRCLALLAQQAGMELTECHLIADPSYLALKPALFHAACWLEERLPPSRRVHLVGVMRVEGIAH